MATKTIINPADSPRVTRMEDIPPDHFKSLDGKKGPDYVFIKQTNRSKAYASNRTKPKKKK